jgi:hypothetical protein
MHLVKKGVTVELYVIIANSFTKFMSYFFLNKCRIKTLWSTMNILHRYIRFKFLWRLNLKFYYQILFYFLYCTMQWPGHASLEHSSVSLIAPVQSGPPLAGTGFVHVLERWRVPFPHVTSHEVQLDQCAHWPLTENVLCQY